MSEAERTRSDKTPPISDDWQQEVEEIALRERLAHRMGGEERVKRQHEHGKLTIRERIDGVVDPGSFHEIGGLAGAGVYQNGSLTDFVPTPYVGGLAKIDGRGVVVGGEDFTVAGGSADMTMERFKSIFLGKLACDYRLPMVLLHDGAGANVSSTDAADALAIIFSAVGPDVVCWRGCGSGLSGSVSNVARYQSVN